MGTALGLIAALATPRSGSAQETPPKSGLQLAPMGAQDTLDPAERLGGRENARDESELGLAFVEVHAPRESAFVGEVVVLELRFGLDAEFLARDAVPLFRRHLDLPVQIEAPWIDAGDSAELTRVFAPVDAAQHALVARNDQVGGARRLPDRNVNGRTFRVFALDIARIERTPGALNLAAPRLHYAVGLEFRDDFLNGRTASGRRDAFVRGADFTLRIDPVPEADRPANWSGAVGRFEVEARVLEPEPAATSVRFELVISGTGDLQGVEVPSARDFAGFALLGVLDDRGRARRRIVYDLVPRSTSTREVAPIEWNAFDPRPPARFRTNATVALPIPEMPNRAESGAPLDGEGDDIRVGIGPFGISRGALLAAALAAVGGLVLYIRSRARKEQRAAPRGEPPSGG